jgi:hypothetical protein
MVIINQVWARDFGLKRHKAPNYNRGQKSENRIQITDNKERGTEDNVEEKEIRGQKSVFAG